MRNLEALEEVGETGGNSMIISDVVCLFLLFYEKSYLLHLLLAPLYFSTLVCIRPITAWWSHTANPGSR